MMIPLSVNAIVNISAMAASIKCDPEVIEGCGVLAVGLYQKAGEWRLVVTEEEELLEQALTIHDEDWPGVFAYEVTEEVGRRIRSHLMQGITPDAAQVREWVRDPVREFCTPDWLAPVLTTYKTLSSQPTA